MYLVVSSVCRADVVHRRLKDALCKQAGGKCRSYLVLRQAARGGRRLVIAVSKSAKKRGSTTLFTSMEVFLSFTSMEVFFSTSMEVE